MHTDMQSQHVPEVLVQRCRKIFWTVYVLDRQLSSLMGVPSSIRDEEISAGLPSYSESSSRAVALDIQVKLSRVIAKISRGNTAQLKLLSRSNLITQMYTDHKDVWT